MTKKSNETRQRKYGLIDKVAPQESDGEDDRKPFPGKGFDFPGKIDIFRKIVIFVKNRNFCKNRISR